LSALKPFEVEFKLYIDEIVESQKAMEKLAQMASAVRIRGTLFYLHSPRILWGHSEGLTGVFSAQRQKTEKHHYNRR